MSENEKKKKRIRELMRTIRSVGAFPSEETTARIKPLYEEVVQTAKEISSYRATKNDPLLHYACFAECHLHDYEAAIEAIQFVLNSPKKKGTWKPEYDITLLRRIGILCRKLNKPAQAEQMYWEAISREDESVSGTEHAVLNRLALADLLSENYQYSVVNREIAEEAERLLGEPVPADTFVVDPEEVETLYRTVLDYYSHSDCPDWAEMIAMTYNKLGNLLSYFPANLKETEDLYDRAIGIYMKLAETQPFGGFDIRLSAVFLNLGCLFTGAALSDQSEISEDKRLSWSDHAQRCFVAALNGLELSYQEPDEIAPYRAYAYNMLGVLSYASGNMTGAEESFRKSDKLYRKLVHANPNQFELCLAKNCLALANAVDNQSEAEDFFAEGIGIYEKFLHTCKDQDFRWLYRFDMDRY